MSIEVEYNRYGKLVEGGLRETFPHLHFVVLPYAELAQQGIMGGIVLIHPSTFVAVANTDDGQPRYIVTINNSTWPSHTAKRTASLVWNIGDSTEHGLRQLSEGRTRGEAAIIF